jgi:hypothetical protein
MRFRKRRKFSLFAEVISPKYSAYNAARHQTNNAVTIMRKSEMWHLSQLDQIILTLIATCKRHAA